MVVPLAVRYVAALAGLLIVLTSARSIIGTVIVPRPVDSWLTRQVDRGASTTFRLLTARVKDFRTRDRILASQVAAVLLSQIIVWLLMFFVGYSLMLWPFVHGITEAFTTAMRDQMASALIAGFHAQKYDQALAAAMPVVMNWPGVSDN